MSQRVKKALAENGAASGLAPYQLTVRGPFGNQRQSQPGFHLA